MTISSKTALAGVFLCSIIGTGVESRTITFPSYRRIVSTCSLMKVVPTIKSIARVGTSESRAGTELSPIHRYMATCPKVWEEAFDDGKSGLVVDSTIWGNQRGGLNSLLIRFCLAPVSRRHVTGCTILF